MSRICEMCAKTHQKAANRSHAKNKTLRVQRANIQTISGVKICTRCMKTIAKAAK